MMVIECKTNFGGKDGLKGQKISAQGNALGNLSQIEFSNSIIREMIILRRKGVRGVTILNLLILLTSVEF